MPLMGEGCQSVSYISCIHCDVATILPFWRGNLSKYSHRTLPLPSPRLIFSFRNLFLLLPAIDYNRLSSHPLLFTVAPAFHLSIRLLHEQDGSRTHCRG